MSKFKRENQLDMEQVLVAECGTNGLDQNLATGSFTTTTTALNINNAQLGVLSWDFDGTVTLGNFITPGTTVSDVKAIKIVQGTPASSQTQYANAYEVGDPAYIETGVIHGCNVRSVAVAKCKPGKWSANVFTDFDTTCINCAGTEFIVNGNIDSVRNDRDFGKTSGEGVSAVFDAPDYDALSTTSPLDHLLQNIVAELNLNSRLTTLSNPGLNRGGSKDYVALAINTAGGSGVGIGTITCDTAIPFLLDAFNTCDDCNDGTPLTSQFLANVEFMRTLACIINDHANTASVTNKITASSTIELVDLSTAGSVDNVDAFIVLGLPQEPVDFNDCFSGSDIKSVCTSIDVDLGGAFAKDSSVKRCKCACEEPVGKARDWYIEESRRHGMIQGTMQVHWSNGDSFGQSYVSKEGYYTSYIIDYYDFEETMTVQEHSPKQAILLFKCGFNCAGTTVAGMATNLAADNPDIATVTTACTSNTLTASDDTVADIQASLDVWLESARTTCSQHTVKGDATKGGPYLV